MIKDKHLTRENKHLRTHGDRANLSKKDKAYRYAMQHPHGFIRQVNMVGAKMEEADINETLGIKDLDRIESIKFIQLKPGSPLVRMFGCDNCMWRGTRKCPHGIKNNDRHSAGYCTDHVRHNLYMAKLMGSSNGMRHMRNMNLISDYRILNYYREKLSDLKKEGSLGDDELKLLNQMNKMTETIGKRIDKAIEQEEGKKLKIERSMSPNDLNTLLARANEKVVEAKVILDEKQGDKE